MALYGDRKYWVRPEKMFFEQIERDGKRFSRFQEIDWEEQIQKAAPRLPSKRVVELRYSYQNSPPSN